MTAVHISKHSLFRLKITVGCRLCAYPSIHVETQDHGRLHDKPHIQAFTFSSQDHGRLPDKHISKHSHENLHARWTPWSTRETRGLWARPPVLKTVPVQAFHSRACLNLHHPCKTAPASCRPPGTRTTLRSSPHARRPSIVDTTQTKAQIWAKGTTERASLIFTKKKRHL